MDNITEPGTYRQRNGDIVDVLKINGDEPYPIRAVGGKSWTRSGQFDRNTPRGNYDLVKRVGETYEDETRDTDLPVSAPTPAANPARDERRDALAIEYSKIMLARDGTCNPIDAVRYADTMLAALRGAA